ncbi:MDR family MFS transporter [Georgenia thermotolerans]|uniref:DHA2 family efflux MFS transporter permease subunit n=1 Tax=Georgenia thermotolerans TaxID=527326 RepID=A0A7J5UTY8_9MICO|nr:MDR family MFS transporter [Georgenia thermotolerans]KAE8765751.1 DHA2 family efflux MFS transporter permease subunit [Georgenia thermotolerans]
MTDAPRQHRAPTPGSRPAPSPQAPAAIETEKVVGRVGPVLAVLVVSAFVMMLNETALSVALPPIMADFAVTPAAGQWLTTGFMLTMAVVIPTTGFLIQRFTSRALFTAALVLFVVGTALAVLAPSFAVVLLARVIQAAGTAIILPLLMTTTLTSVPVEKRGMVMGLNSVVISMAPAVGPTLSGVVVDHFGWRALFGMMLPFGLVVLALGLVLIRTTNETIQARMDAGSVVLAALGFGGLVYALASLGAVLQGHLAPLAALAVGVVALVLFVRRQLRLQRTDAALLDLRPFTVHNFRISVAVVVIAMATMLGTVVVLPIYLQAGAGVGIATTGLLLLPGGLIQGILSPVAGKIYDVAGPRPLVIPGTILMAGGQFWLSTVGADTPLGLVVAMHLVFCTGMALVMTPLMTVSLGSLPRHLYPHGSAIMNTLQQLAGAAGTAVLVAALTIGAAAAAAGQAGEAQATVAGTEVAFVVGGCLGLVGVLCAPFVRRLRPDTAPVREVVAEREAAQA